MLGARYIDDLTTSRAAGPPDTNPADQPIWKVPFQSCFYFPTESFRYQDWKCSGSQGQIKPQTIRSVLRGILNPATSDESDQLTGNNSNS